jgi:hypothetical protein
LDLVIPVTAHHLTRHSSEWISHNNRAGHIAVWDLGFQILRLIAWSRCRATKCRPIIDSSRCRFWADSIINTVYDGGVNGGIKIVADDSGLASDVSDRQLKPSNG